MDSSSAADDQRWKRKYFDSLEELERKERGWESVEHTLYDSLSRVALAAYGVDRGLDRRIDRLREAVRAHRDGERVGALVDLVCTAADEARAQRDPDEIGDPRLFAVRLIDALELPAPQQREARKLKKRLAGGDCSLDQAAQAIAAMVTASTPASREPPTSRSPLRRLFAGAGERDTPTSADAVILGRLIAALELPEAERAAARQLGARCASDTVDDTEALFEEVAALIGRALAAAGRPVEAADAAPADGDDSAATDPEAETGSVPAAMLAEVLLALLDQIELPAESQPRIEELKRRVGDGITADTVAGVLTSVAGLVGELRAEMRRERLDMQVYLAGLSERLGYLDGALSLTREDHAASLHGSEELERRVAGEVDGMRKDAAAADDLELLRRAIEHRLVAISGQLESHLGDEQQRFSAASARIEALEGQLREAREETENLQCAIRAAEQRAARDGLTGALNRATFDERLEAEHARVRRYGGTLALLFWDIDHFKAINDSFGHPAGDRVLQTVARLLTEGVRETDLVARYGGEEFVVLMPQTTIADALAVAEKLRVAITHTQFHHRDRRVAITASCGAAELLANESAADLVQRADAALYQAKEDGRNRCCQAAA